MDTKLKNRHKWAIVSILLAIIIPTFIMAGQYPRLYEETMDEQERNAENYMCSQSFMKQLLRCSYVFYRMEDGAQVGDELFDEYFESFQEAYEQMMPYAHYQIQDLEGKVIKENLENNSEKKKIDIDALKNYVFGAVLKFDGEGVPEILGITGEYSQQQEYVLRKVISNGSYAIDDYTASEAEQPPRNRIYYYLFTEENFAAYLEEECYIFSTAGNFAAYLIMILGGIVGLTALLLPRVKSLNTGEEWIFGAPLELVCIVVSCGMGILENNIGWMFTRDSGNAGWLDYFIWMSVFAVFYWAVSCLRQIFVLGIREYLKKRTLTYLGWKYLKCAAERLIKWGKCQKDRLVHSLSDLDLKEENNKVILKIVMVNFVILVVLCMMWFYGIVGLIIYSILLFFILRKYFNDLRGKYALLLKATNEIAEGNLDVEISGDLGVFSPFRTEIQKIQSGFRKAVKEEVKSQKLKTELISNVSHDLKTPLTAIITYIDLLKDEKDSEKCQTYIRILEKKSLRLKVLIEDLFEISKASSENIVLNMVNVDIVNLFKQVKLEMEDKIEQSDLTFRMNFPEKKLVLKLDSQKTYRIFENLLVNVVKYAMPHTRVFVEMENIGGDAVIRIKNISASELDFDPNEITERFVRGDTSRNTEGSGLGLAIVKSFVELQKGTLHIETEADLFKVEIHWPIPETFS